jgi:HD superfamily phosphodiesterase
VSEFEKIALLYLAYQSALLHDIGAALRHQASREYMTGYVVQLKKDIHTVASGETAKLLGI